MLPSGHRREDTSTCRPPSVASASFHRLSPAGYVTPQDMLREAQARNRVATWIIRFTVRRPPPPSCSRVPLGCRPPPAAALPRLPVLASVRDVAQGFFMMWLGQLLFLAPLSVALDLVPFLGPFVGDLVQWGAGLISLPISLMLRRVRAIAPRMPGTDGSVLHCAAAGAALSGVSAVFLVLRSHAAFSRSRSRGSPSGPRLPCLSSSSRSVRARAAASLLHLVSAAPALPGPAAAARIYMPTRACCRLLRGGGGHRVHAHAEAEAAHGWRRRLRPVRGRRNVGRGGGHRGAADGSPAAAAADAGSGRGLVQSLLSSWEALAVLLHLLLLLPRLA